ncbi:MAG: hypothetical protein IBX62_06755 [Coriobacteriia bacterium]|nr:hypothetical protein [Coriobacteriia bacterium]
MGRTRFMLSYGTVTALFGLGTFAAAHVFWPLAVVAPVYLVVVWMVLHRLRMCAFCRQRDCPGHPIGRPPAGAEPGFRGWERPAFYTSFPLMVGALLIAVFIYDRVFGFVALGYAAFALWSYGTKVCPTCELPCPLSAARGAAAAGASTRRVEERVPRR